MKKISLLDILLIPLCLTLIVSFLFGSGSSIPFLSAWANSSDVVIFLYAVGYAVYSLRDINRTGHAKSTGISIFVLLIVSILDFYKYHTLNNSISLVMAIVLATDALYKRK